jgi:ketosteroid isomerase-like protein
MTSSPSAIHVPGSAQQNTEIVQRMYHAFVEGDIGTVLAHLADDVEWVVPGPAELPYAGTYHGREEVAQFFHRLGESTDFEEFAPYEYIAQGDRAVALGTDRERSRATGRATENRWAMTFTLRDGRVSHFASYHDTAAATAIHRPA